MKNVLFVLSDQQRSLPAFEGRELTLKRHFNVNYENHFINSILCSSSRATILTGLHTYQHRVFDNVNLPYQDSLDPRIKTIGHEAKQRGYRTAYFGKMHVVSGKVTRTIMKKYGFDTFQSYGDIQGEVLDGYKYDAKIVRTATRWLKTQNPKQSQPWFICLCLINPHDCVFFAEDPSKTLAPTAIEPNDPAYQRKWPEYQQLEKVNTRSRIPAHRYYAQVENAIVGTITDWPRFQNYYFNCVLAMDKLANEFIESCLSHFGKENLHMLFTSDHGEMTGAYGMHGKGPLVFDECIRVPLFVSNNQTEKSVLALTSHLDIYPLLLSLMIGKDLFEPRRDHVLFNSQLYLTIGSTPKNIDKMRKLMQSAVTLDSTDETKMSVKDSGVALQRNGHVWGLVTDHVKLSCYYSPGKVRNMNDLKNAIKQNTVNWEVLVRDESGVEYPLTGTMPDKSFIHLFVTVLETEVPDWTTCGL